MKMNMLINKISELFKDDDLVKIYSYDNKVCMYSTCFSNSELRKIFRIIQQEKILIEVVQHNKTCISLTMDD